MGKDAKGGFKKLERKIYIGLWIVVALVPLLLQTYDHITGSDPKMEWDKVFKTWLAILPFFILFWVHDLLLMPLLMRRKLKWLYFILTMGVIAVMMVILDAPNREFRRQREKQSKEIIIRDIETGEEIEHFTREGVRRPPINMFLLSNIIFALFVVSVNVATKLYFRGVANRRRIAALEAENNATRLQFLKYQINPHFFMNTLNNIHALIDIDAEEARTVVMELSKMMRYVLYDIDKDEVYLRQEIEFLQNYIKLMRIRLTDNVEINVSIPENVGNIKLPPLLFIPFVENIFKHGISYREPSEIDISISVDEDGVVTFHSVNTKHRKKDADNHHGIGLQNLRRRLELLYPGNYTLEVCDGATTFETTLKIPTQVHSPLNVN